MESIRKTILIVDDEQPLLDALEFKFEQEGFTVLTANNGEEGLSTALAKRPDMILLDIIMPKMDGLTMLGKLRENVWGKTAKVIMLTNLSDWSNTSKAVEHDVHDVLVKSDWKISDVVTQVKKKLGVE